MNARSIRARRSLPALVLAGAALASLAACSGDDGGDGGGGHGREGRRQEEKLFHSTHSGRVGSCATHSEVRQELLPGAADEGVQPVQHPRAAKSINQHVDLQRVRRPMNEDDRVQQEGDREDERATPRNPSGDSTSGAAGRDGGFVY